MSGAVCDNCGHDHHSPAQLADCIASVLAPVPEQGVDRCECGCKYWEGGRCIDCGDRFDPPASTEGLTADGAYVDGFVWCDLCHTAHVAEVSNATPTECDGRNWRFLVVSDESVPF